MPEERYRIGTTGMGSYVPPTVLSQISTVLSCQAKLLLGWILARKGKEGKVHWKQEKILTELGMESDRTLRRHLKELEDVGLLARLRQDEERGRPNLYLVTDHPWFGWNEKTLAHVRKVLSENGLPTWDNSVRTEVANGCDWPKLSDNHYQPDLSGNVDSYQSDLSGKPSFDYILGKENISLKENGPSSQFSSEPENTSSATNGSETEPKHTFSPRRTPESDEDGKNQSGTDGVLSHPLPPPAPALGNLDENVDDGWDVRTAERRWNRTPGLPKLKGEAVKYLGQRYDQGLDNMPWSLLESAIEAFASHDGMRDAKFPWKAFWKDPYKWAPDGRPPRENAPQRIQGVQTPAAPPPLAPRPASAPPSAPVVDYVALWNRDGSDCPIDDTIRQAWDWAECAKDQKFHSEFARIAQWSAYLRKEHGQRWMTLQWCMKKNQGNAQRNYQRLLEGQLIAAGEHDMPRTREDIDRECEQIRLEGEEIRRREEEAERNKCTPEQEQAILDKWRPIFKENLRKQREADAKRQQEYWMSLKAKNAKWAHLLDEEEEGDDAAA